jgi:hypothetical protein
LGREKLVDGCGEDQLEAGAADSDRHAVARRPEPGLEVQRLAAGVDLLHEEDEAPRAEVASPRSDLADERLPDSLTARPRVHPHRDELDLAWVEPAEAADDARPALVVLGDEENLLDALGRLCRPVPPGRLRLADGVVVP